MAKKNEIISLDPKVYLDKSRIEVADIGQLNTENMKIYGANINIARVFPEIHDGLKLVERRILYSMYAITKCIKRMSKVHTISGDVMKIHAHGDASVNGTLVRITQPWNMVLPYIEGQGNFGTIAGDEAAAARYIEAKLSKYALDCFFSDFNPKVVDMQPTYNRDMEEPITLPSKYPNCLLSSADGLGFGPATHIPTFNLEEVLQATISLIKDPSYEPELIPDITTGCLIIDEGNFSEINRTGRGTFKMRAEIIKDDDRKAIIIKSIPFQVSLLGVKEKIAELVNNKTIQGFRRINDYSAKTIHLELFFKPEIDLDEVIELLYTKTRLQETYPVQMKFVDNYEIVDFNVKSALLRWIDIRYQFKRKLFIRKLVELEERNHILNVLIMILDGENGEKTINIIKKSNREEIVRKLTREYNITSLQATKISNMRLNEFSKDALEEYKKELKENKKSIKNISDIIISREKIDKIIISELEEGILKYRMPRKSKVIKLRKKGKYASYEARIIITKNGYIKKMKKTKTNNKIGNIGEADLPTNILSIMNTDTLIVFDKKGSIHNIEVGKLNQDDLSSIGTTLSQYCNINGSVVSLMKKSEINSNTEFVFVTKNGIIKRTEANNFSFKTSQMAISLKPNDELVHVIAIEKNTDLFVYSKKGVGLRFNTSDVPATKRMSIGVIAFPINDKDEVIGVKEISNKSDYLIIISKKGYVKKCSLDVFASKKRRSEPIDIIPLNKTDEVFDVVVCKPNSNIQVITTTATLLFNEAEIEETLKYESAKKFIKLNKKDNIVKINIIE